jgi:phage gpG-like protein
MGLVGLEGMQRIESAVLALPRLMSRATRDAADLLEDTIHAQFEAGVDPYGMPWAPLAESTMKRGRTPPPLTDSGALAAVRVDPLQSAGILVAFDEDYARYHQSGTSRMPQRRLVPDDGNFQHSLWYPPIVEAYSNAMLRNGGWRAAGADEEPRYFDAAAE